MDNKLSQRIYDIAYSQTGEWFSNKYHLDKEGNNSLIKYICPEKQKCTIRQSKLLENFKYTQSADNEYCEFFSNDCKYFGSVNSNGMTNERQGWKLLRKIFRKAYRYDNLTEEQFAKKLPIKEFTKKNGFPNGQSWCGIFATWVWQEAGLNVYWHMQKYGGGINIDGQPYAAYLTKIGNNWQIKNFTGSLEKLANFVEDPKHVPVDPDVGDIIYLAGSSEKWPNKDSISNFQHIAIISKVEGTGEGKKFYAFNGNSFNGGISTFFTQTKDWKGNKLDNDIPHPFYYRKHFNAYHTVISVEDISFDQWQKNNEKSILEVYIEDIRKRLTLNQLKDLMKKLRVGDHPYELNYNQICLIYSYLGRFIEKGEEGNFDDEYYKNFIYDSKMDIFQKDLSEWDSNDWEKFYEEDSQ